VLDPRIESKANHICHVVGENEGIMLSDKSRHDIFQTVRAATGYFKEDLDEIREDNPYRQLNELKIWLKTNKPEGFETVLYLMDILKNQAYIRDIKLHQLKKLTNG
jgi:hypothetical protein